MLKALPTLFPHLVGTTNNARVEFYNKFQREADEYDRDFVKKCGGDLDTTLIFVGFFPDPSIFVPMLMWHFWRIGWFVLRRCICFHRSCSDPAPAGLYSTELRRHYVHRQFHVSSNTQPWCPPHWMDWSRSHHCQRSVPSLLKFSHFPPRCICCHARQAVAQSLLTGRDARISH